MFWLLRYKKWRRRSLRKQLFEVELSGARVAHLPAFLDRFPKPGLHRAYKHAFNRGFTKESSTLNQLGNEQNILSTTTPTIIVAVDRETVLKQYSL